MRIILVLIASILLIACATRKVSSIELISPEQSSYWGHQVIFTKADTVFVDTSFYNDLSLQPFVDPVHFMRNKTVGKDLNFQGNLRPQFDWMLGLDMKKIKRLHRRSRRSDCVCYEYLVKADNSYFSIYLPEDTTCYDPGITSDLKQLETLFVFEKDTSFTVIYGQ